MAHKKAPDQSAKSVGGRPLQISDELRSRFAAVRDDLSRLSPRALIKLCQELRTIYQQQGQALARQLRKTPRKSVLRDDARRIKIALSGCDEVEAILTGHDDWGLHEEEQTLLKAARRRRGKPQRFPRPYRPIDRLISTLRVEQHAREDAVASAFRALLPISARPERVMLAIKRSRGGRHALELRLESVDERRLLLEDIFKEVSPQETTATGIAQAALKIYVKRSGEDLKYLRQAQGSAQSRGSDLTQDEKKEMARLVRAINHPPALDTVRKHAARWKKAALPPAN
jgi:hypothetical protein